jgi:hypothetical protein
MKHIIKEILETVPKNSRKRNLTEAHRDFLDMLYPTLDFAYQCHLLLNDSPTPKCKVCDNMPARNKVTCSRKCREQLKKDNGIDSFQKMRESLTARYGVSNPAHVDSMQEKRINTNIEKYGSKVSMKTKDAARSRSSEFNSKGRKTLRERYGVENAGQLEGHSDKIKATMLQTYGVDNYYRSDAWAVKSKINQLGKLNSVCGPAIDIINISPPDISLLSSYDNPNNRIEIHCRQCQKDESIPSETFKYRLRNFQTPCGSCAGTNGKGSAAEKEIHRWLTYQYNGKIIENDRTIIAPYELDIVLPELGIAIEYCGLYWHNDTRLDKKYHFNKMKRCQEQNIKLITIFEDEWIHKSQIVKDRLMTKLHLNKNSNRIGARKCQLVELAPANAKEFVETHHIQGYMNASVQLGLTHNGILVAVMTFTKGNITKRHKNWELSRFCLAADHQIPGAASKLFSYFVKLYNPEQVVTYSDLRWNTGNVYTQIGFADEKFTGLNYWYVNGTKRLHRFNLRKTANDDPNISESQLRRQEGWNRIWDCGNMKYVWNA